MFTLLQTMTQQDIEKIHQASMGILAETGIVFNDDECLEIFKKTASKSTAKPFFSLKTR